MNEKVSKIFAMIVQVLGFLAPSLKDVGSILGIKETKEMIVGVNELSLVLMKGFKDGVQFSDFASFWATYQTNPEFQSSMKAAWDKYQSIPSEVKDIDVGEGLELTAVQIEYVPKMLEALKKDEASS